MPRREPSQNDKQGPTDVPEYVPEPKERPVDVPEYTPTPLDRPVTVSTMGEKPVGALRHNPMLRAWPVDNRLFEPKANQSGSRRYGNGRVGRSHMD